MKKLYSFGLFLLFFGWANAQSIEMPVQGVSSQQPAQSGYDVRNLIDGKTTTEYHSVWGKVGIPDVVTFTFSDRVQSLGKFVYTPRQQGTNGIWTNIDIYYSTKEAPANFIKINDAPIAWALNNTVKTYQFPSEIANVKQIRVNVNAGGGSFSGGAEAEFFSSKALAPVPTDCPLPTEDLNSAMDTAVKPLADGSYASNFQTGEDITKSFDGNMSTLYHSSYAKTASQWPITLMYKFDGTTPISFLRYYPRQDGGTNGNLGNVEISYSTAADPNTFITLATENWMQNNDPKTVTFAQTIQPQFIRILVKDGYNGFASVAEMQFFQKASNPVDIEDYANIFTDQLFTNLQPGVTQRDIDAVTSPFFRALAQCIFNGTYSKKDRYNTYRSYVTPAAISSMYKVGTYDLYENPTGILFSGDTNTVVFAKGIPADVQVYLKVRDFEKEGSTVEASVPLTNGINIVKLGTRGLGYIAYYSNRTDLPNIEVNIPTGYINGVYKTMSTTSAEWKTISERDFYTKVDILGHYAHLVTDRNALVSQNPDGPQALIDKYDIVQKNQLDQIGIYKYNKKLENHMFVLHESSGGYFAGGQGVHLDLSWGVPNILAPTKLDVWGIAHEMGHINQIRPDIKWAGTTEVTVNLYSSLAYYHLVQTPVMPRTPLELNEAAKTDFPQVVGNRYGEFFKYVLIGKQNPQGFTTDDAFRRLVPFWQLNAYYSLSGAAKGAPVYPYDMDMTDEATNTYVPTELNGIDYARWYATVVNKSQQTNSTGLSHGQLAMNFLKNVADAVQEDLTDFFIKSGFLTPFDQDINDYGMKRYTVTQQMVDETIAYIKGKGYPQPVSPVLNYISANSIDIYKNRLPLSGTTGAGAAPFTNAKGTFIQVETAKWPNAVAFETYDANKNLISVSIYGTGNTPLTYTFVDFPANAATVYAVGFDGKKIQVWPATLGVADAADSVFKFYPNPVKDVQQLAVSFGNTHGKYALSIYDMAGKQVYKSGYAAVGVLNQNLKTAVQPLVKGVYIAVFVNQDGKSHTVKFIRE